MRLKTSYFGLVDKQVTTQACDLADISNLDKNLASLLSKVTDGGKSKVNHVVFTAGDGLNQRPISELTLEECTTTPTVRIVAPLLLSKHLLNTYLERSPDSTFTLTTGVNSTMPSKGWTMTAWRGQGVEGLMRGLATDMAPIRVNAVSPGAIETELLANVPEELLKSWAETTTVKRIGRPEDTA